MMRARKDDLKPGKLKLYAPRKKPAQYELLHVPSEEAMLNADFTSDVVNRKLKAARNMQKQKEEEATLGGFSSNFKTMKR